MKNNDQIFKFKITLMHFLFVIINCSESREGGKSGIGCISDSLDKAFPGFFRRSQMKKMEIINYM